MDEPFDAIDPGEPQGRGLSFRTRLTGALIGTAIVPLAAFGLLVYFTGTFDATLGRVLLFALVVTILVAVLFSYLVATDLTRPLRAIASAVDRVSAGDLSTPIQMPGEDELARLADSHNRLAADLDRRDREVSAMNDAISDVSVRDGVAFLLARAAADAKRVFGLPEARLLLGNPDDFPVQEVVPGEMRPLRAVLRAGDDESIGVLVGRLPPLRPWARADQDLLELYASEIAVAIRNAELYERVEAQNAQLLELDAAKDDFLRGVSHNLQTPLTSIRAHADQLARDRPDRRLEVIEEQADRLSRMVRQLLTVTRLESGALKPRVEVVNLAARTRRAWEALGFDDVPFELDDGAHGWLAIADADQLDQVVWALLDNAVKYGRRTPVEAVIVPDPDGNRLRLTIADHGVGVADEDRERLFGRFVRGNETTPDEGSGLGLFVSRELCRAMDGDLVLEPADGSRGAAFSVYLPAELAQEG
jgi:signal transduction histidine kinase/HAMP domain-containing protein